MKTLKFKPHLIDKILSGKKYVTFRLLDDKNLGIDDEVEFLNSDTKAPFAKVKITDVREKKLGEISDTDFAGNGEPESHESMLARYRVYYGDTVNLDTVVKIVSFELQRI
ncbi:MAG: ASCH domain-containing protein [Candidatus Sungbacteria bacterium]|nr:ASCH domain-containing protein [Candidatus Sungbacteria bacterium]